MIFSKITATLWIFTFFFLSMHFVAYFSSEFFYSGKIMADEVDGTMANCVDYPIFYRFLFGLCGAIFPYMVLSLYHRVTRCQVLFYELTGLLMLPSVFGLTFVSHRPD